MIKLIHRDDLFELNLMQTVGSFSWWYVDLVDFEGNGAVLIWFAGLPFLPLKSLKKIPKNLSGLTVSVYRNHKLDFYAFQTYPPEFFSVNADQTQWRVGDSHLKMSHHRDQVTLTADLRISYAGSSEPFVGQLRVKGKSRITSPVQAAGTTEDHVWSPMMLRGQGNLEYRWAAHNDRIEGTAYFDRNQSERPLTQLGIRDWHWCRLSFPNETVVLYFLQDHEGDWQRWAFAATDKNDFKTIPVIEHKANHAKKDRYGIRWNQKHEIYLKDREHSLEIELRSPVDRSPFYMRHLLKAKQGDDWAYGVYERVLPKKIPQQWMQPLIAMRINEWHRNKSIWLALFEGPKRGKVGRLFKSWTQSSSAVEKGKSL